MRPYLKSAISLLTLIALVIVFCKSLAYREQADSAKADMLFERGQLFEQNKQMDSAAYYYRQAITMLPVARDDRRACIFRNRLGKLFLDVNLFPMAETVYREAMDCVPDGDDKTELSKATRGLGKSFLFRGITDSALVYLNQAVRLTSSVSETNERLQAYSNLSLACAEVGDLTRSLEYNEKALALASDSIDYFRNWYARASLMTNFQQYDSAWHYYKLAAGSPNLYTKTGCFLPRRRSSNPGHMVPRRIQSLGCRRMVNTSGRNRLRRGRWRTSVFFIFL